jgi:hypothetical protein
VFVPVAAAAGLAACSSEPEAATPTSSATQAAVCDASDGLRTSLADLQDIDVAQQGTAAALENAWASVEASWSDFVDAAGTEYDDAVAVVQSAAQGVDDAVAAVQDSPTAETLTAAVTAVTGFVQEAESLVDEVSSTC